MLEPVAGGLRVIALRTPTLLPATHTNCYTAGRRELTLFDPASPWRDEQDRLVEALDAEGARVGRIVLTHHHPDHVGGAEALRDVLAARGQDVPIVAHAVTRELLRGELRVDEVLADGDTLRCEGTTLAVMHTPGHASGHLVFHDASTGATIAGDMVAGIGTILLDPVDGDLGDYLDSLERMGGFHPTHLLPSHGPVLEHGEAVLGFYVAHRHQRTVQVREALDKLGTADLLAIARAVYGTSIPEDVLPVAAIQALAHLSWLRGRGLAEEVAEGWRPVR